MVIGIVGSRSIVVDDIGAYLPPDTDEIVSGGAKGVDSCARLYAQKTGVSFRELLPDYQRFGRAAPLKRNDEIIAHAEFLLVFWDGKSKGTQYVIRRCAKLKKPMCVVLLSPL